MRRVLIALFFSITLIIALDIVALASRRNEVLGAIEAKKNQTWIESKQLPLSLLRAAEQSDPNYWKSHYMMNLLDLNNRRTFVRLFDSATFQFVVFQWVGAETMKTTFFNLLYLGRCKGNDITGVVQASKAFFSKDVSQLSDEESLELIWISKAPSIHLNKSKLVKSCQL